MTRNAFLLLAFTAGLFSACKGSGASLVGGDGNGQPYNPSGEFTVMGLNVLEGQVWELNRPIRIEFNHPLDPSSISFSSVQIRSTNASAAGHPVTGTFELAADEDDRVLIFRPTCPTDDANSNGAFLPGGVDYEITMPVGTTSGNVLRDTSNRPLSKTLRRNFISPRPPAEPLFLDLTPGPALLTEVNFPEGLNLFTKPDPVIEIVFNQSIDGRPANLNTDRLFVLFSAGVIGSGQEDVFPNANRLPGSLVLIANCVESGAVVQFLISGLLPPNRKLRLQMNNDFRDIVGLTNIENALWESYVTPTLSDLYEDPSWVEASETADEFRDEFDTATFLDADAEVPLPFATIGNGFVSASFEFGGTYTGKNFYVTAPYRELFTDSTQPFTDDNGEAHYLSNGVLNVHDFRIDSGTVLRCRGKVPLVIYATGVVTIDGELNLNGNNAKWPSSLQSPQFTEGGAQGECGGGQGGDASWINDAETPRGESGDGPFGLTHAGGQGGEGVYGDGRYAGGANGNNTFRHVAGGGGGGGFARTQNESILWAKWPQSSDFKPNGVDNAGPDHIASRHTQWDIQWANDPDSPAYGAEDGMRGTAADNQTLPGASTFSGGYGIEDLQKDTEVTPSDTGVNLDPAWTAAGPPPFHYGNPTLGSDHGRGGSALFIKDDDLKDDFWGRRLRPNGTVAVGELLTPWAGSGGGGGGDSVAVQRPDLDGIAGPDPIPLYIPLNPFQRAFGSNSTGWVDYRKGAGGGGGGGQCMIFSIGMIRIGLLGKLTANGGVGYSGESVIYTDNGIGGSGGGSGGHLVLHSATGLDVSAFNVGTAVNAGQFSTLTPPATGDPVQAFGGRRGWSTPNDPPKHGSLDDGNGNFRIGRGGAGANGVIQVHVPDPLTDIVWPAAAATGIKAYIGDPVDTDKLEEALALFTAPSAYALIPFFAAASMVQSQWIDTGLAGLRLSTNQTPGSWDYPEYANALLRFAGTSTGTGLVNATNEKVDTLPPIATGSTLAVTFDAYELTVPLASSLFDAKFLRNPALLIGYDVYPKASGTKGFQIVGASYDRAANRIRVQTRSSDTPMSFEVDPNSPTWSIRLKFLRIETTGVRDSLPANSSIKLEFQGANESFPGTNEPGAPFPGATDWTTDLADLTGFRWIRWRMTFDLDTQSLGADLNTPRPLVDYLKLPFVW
ncbi:MAG: hypothetical protein O3A20_02125 [Planctomycetota bacterium]|nr:hypothetical protein [Planctomycetota bacterium]